MADLVLTQPADCKPTMHLLLSNDDGYRAPGLECLARHLNELAELTIIAPSRDRSGASNSLTLDQDLHVHTAANGFHYVEEGTPTDCVHLAITGLMEREPDMVVSGINSGANLGDDVIYSGTVAAAMEGRTLGLPAIAVSMISRKPRHYETGARVACTLVELLSKEPLPSEIILNVNVPDVPLEKLRGLKITRLGHRHRAEPAERALDANGASVWRVGPPGPDKDGGDGTDFHAVREGFASITPMQVDLTRHAELDSLAQWLERTSL